MYNVCTCTCTCIVCCTLFPNVFSLCTLYIYLASFPVLPRTRFTFTCDNCGGEHFETGKAWSETSREVDVGTIVLVYYRQTRQVGVAKYNTTSTSRDVSDQAFPVSKCSPPQLSHVNVNRVRGRTGNEAIYTYIIIIVVT